MGRFLNVHGHRFKKNRLSVSSVIQRNFLAGGIWGGEKEFDKGNHKGFSLQIIHHSPFLVESES
jgi:hypothetical protein